MGQTQAGAVSSASGAGSTGNTRGAGKSPAARSAENVLRRMTFLPVRAGGVAFVHSRTQPRQFVGARSGVLRNMEPRAIVHPVDQSVFKDRVRSHDPMRNIHDVADLPRRLRYGDINHAQAVAVPGIEHKILDNTRS